ncbi:MAG: aminotransferase class V-fold PLP-dependent enzyme [Myxococcota bacterium]|nr:aminotransferase class V-fold PLP-dependent enzyme [Myxococcota bacterium]
MDVRLSVGSFRRAGPGRYAGAQKNAGPAGVTLVIVDKGWMDTARDDIPAIWRYATQAAKGSTYNTPPVFPIYVVGLVAQHLEAQGGVAAAAERNEAKAGLLYDGMSRSGGFYVPAVSRASDRSRMNVAWRIADRALEPVFVAEAAAAGLSGLKGHRLVGGIRASIYNAMPLEGCERLAAFMDDFAKRHATG